MAPMRGKARKFGDNIDTDTITPASTLHLPIKELKKHAFSPINPGFCETIQAGDIIVAGKNFGCGSSREQATAVLKELGINVVIAESIARIYYRNCVALGVYPVLCEGCGPLFDEGDEIEIDFENGQIKNGRTGRATSFRPLSEKPQEIMLDGGILSALKRAIEMAELSERN